MNKKIKAGIIGGSGFTGLELIKILNKHKYVKISFVTSRTLKDQKVSEAFPSFKEYGNKELFYIDRPGKKDLEEIDILFLCLPPLKSMEFLKGISDKYNLKIIDIGSDFRIKDPGKFKQWYGSEHVMKSKLSDFVYGLTEINKEKIKGELEVEVLERYPNVMKTLKKRKVEIKRHSLTPPDESI